nr:UDP-glycosyltransferase family 466 member C1 [Frankliniella occidentalis]
MSPIQVVALLLLLVQASNALRVLGLFPYNGRSHMVVLEAMMEALVERGHEVVVLSTFPHKEKKQNYTDLDISEGSTKSLVNKLSYEQMTFHRLYTATLLKDFAGAEMCRRLFATQHFRDVMSGKYGKFDVVFTELFGTDCCTAVAYKLQVPFISMLVAPDYAWMHDRVGSVDNPSYIVANFEPYAGAMDLWHRIQNTFMSIAHKLLFKIECEYPSDIVVKEFFGPDIPPLSEIIKRTSLVMVNTHVSVNPARPVNPNVLHIGGLHLKNRNPARTNSNLDADLRAWLDSAQNGVIFFTLGSMVRTSTLPEASIKSLLGAFSALGPKYKVLWKYEKDDLDLPPNVRTAPWLSGVDVLAHPNVILFMTHGGLMSSTEAIFYGVPMLGIPLFSDQQSNIALYEYLGVAEGLHHTELADEDKLRNKILKMVETDQYRNRARKIADRYWDRPRSPREEAVWWTEYVVRHQGALHLRPLGADLPLYQYLLLDVLAVVLLAILMLFAVVRIMLKTVCYKSTKEKKN